MTHADGTDGAVGAGTRITRHEDAEAGLGEYIAQLTADARSADGVSPFNEETLLNLGERGALLARGAGGQPAGLALYRPLGRDDAIEAELAIDPAQRGRGHGTQLLSELMTLAPRTVTWAHGRLPAAVALAQRAGMQQTRLLLRLAMTLTAADPEDSTPAAHGVRLERFRPGQDDAAFLRLNAEAFADHPEQGALDARGLDARMREPWFRPEDFLLAFDADGELIGYNWLKISPEEGEGEIYVIAVAPRAAGRGLGRALMRAGHDHMRTRGVHRTTLYVEGDNEPAVRLYRSLGYREDLADAQYTGKRS